MRDTSGANTPQEGGDRVALAVNEAYRLRRAPITYAGREVIDGHPLDQLTVTHYQHLQLTRFTVGAPRPLSAYSRPTTPPTGASIDGGAVSVTVPFRLLNNHIYVGRNVMIITDPTEGFQSAAPVAPPPSDAGRFDRSGMWIKSQRLSGGRRHASWCTVTLCCGVLLLP